ncbi:hypothetical protein CJ205_05980 [Dolosicoccus paucivorans]|uniref:Cell envelope-related transcriptional attenuator domain-containing protein n=1 Tax=Dolosicoccus paucivorans TaxID=84521 RepID=A0A2N6SM29_9LACT|nr:hypothetical protein CJ206_06570 [Dolosicoccus paucivorans]PMC58127.1 hypothetical protein CJ205_05980 [Dolosicoccus paucivorans]
MSVLKKIIYGLLIGWLGAFSLLTSSAQADGVTNIVMTGSDRQADGSGQSDSTLVVSYNEGTGQVSLISLPQNLMISIPEQGEGTLAEAYSIGGGQLVADGIEEWTDASIDDYLTLDMAGVAELIDEVGGVTVYVSESFEQDGYSFQEGDTLTMDGSQALAYMRHLPQEGELVSKQERQAQVIRSLGEELAGEDLSAFGYIKLYQNYSGYIDSSLGKMEMINLVKELIQSGSGLSYHELDEQTTPDQLQMLLQS